MLEHRCMCGHFTLGVAMLAKRAGEGLERGARWMEA